MPITPSPRGRARRLFSLPAVAALTLALAACGSGSSSSSSTTASSGGGGASNRASNAQNAAQTKLRDCLRKQGIELPAAGGGAPAQNIDRDKLQAAFDGPCKAAQQAAQGDVSAGDQQQFQDQLTKFASCMRKAGVDVPDPSSSGGVPTGGAQIDQSDPKVAAAIKKCQGALPQGVPGGTGGSGQ